MSITSTSESVIVAQLGARMHYAVPVMFQQAGLLKHFYTDLWFDHLPSLAQAGIKSIPHKGLQRFISRRHPSLPNEKVSAYTPAGLRYAQQLRSARSREEETRLFLNMGKKFADWVLQQLTNDSISNPDIFYLFNSAALEILTQTNRQDSFGILEQTLVPRFTERTILQNEYQRRELNYPQDSLTEEYEQREFDEWQHSDVVICGSKFVADAVNQLSEGKATTKVIPYGYTPPSPADVVEKKASGTHALQILFVGHGGIRKGLPYLLEAIGGLSDVHLTIVGHTDLPESLQESYSKFDHITWENRVPRHKMMEYYHQSDVFVLPSLCEGSATVIYEAMSYALPIICTPNSGSVITDGQEGFLVPIQSAEAIREKIIQLRDDTQLRNQLSSAAQKTSQQYTVEQYQKRLVTFVKEQV
jgi:glycosyltransferase involved in cell wall biosynthesis